MAIRRMFSKDVVGTDSFLDMPVSAQALFFHLGMEGDDDGFVKNPKTVMRTIGAKPDDMSILTARGFIIPFNSGVIAIRHWRILNTLRNDRYRPTVCSTEKGMLQLVNGEYVENGIPNGYQLDTNCQPMVYHPEPQHNITEQNKTEQNRTEDTSAPQKPIQHKYGSYNNVLLTDEDLCKLQDEYPDWEQRIERLSAYIAQSGKRYKSHLATIRNWARRDNEDRKDKSATLNYQQHTYREQDFGEDFYYNPERDFR